MRKVLSIILTVAMCFAVCSLFFGCKVIDKLVEPKDKEQHYHADYEELEHRINDELGEFLVIGNITPLRYASHDDYSFRQFYIYLQPSYLLDNQRITEVPVYVVIDRFRCIFNDYLDENQGLFDDDIKIQVLFGTDAGDHEEYDWGTLSNYVYDLEHEYHIYDHLIFESVPFYRWYGRSFDGCTDYEFMEDKEDIVFLYLLNTGLDADTSVDKIIEAYQAQIELFPNVAYVTFYPLNEQDRDSLTSMLEEVCNVTVVR